jgi:outer membrane receptor protein involved in Fe transport
LYGAELSASHYLTDRLNLFLSAAYVKTRFKNYITNGQDYSGNQFAFAPALTGSIGGKYYFANNWLVSGDINYQSESYSSPSNASETKIQSYTLINAQIGYQTDKWSAFLYGRNLTNKSYATQYYFGGNGTREFIKIGEPRFIGLKMNVNF